jgi:phage FluMu gp28-like protein
MFYRMANPSSDFIVSRVRRSEAWEMGLKIFDLKTGKPITPTQARAAALDKASYDQNYECAFSDEASALLTHELINACEYKGENRGGWITDGAESLCFICERDWTGDCLAFLAALRGPLGIGVDIGRNRNMTFISVGEKIGGMILIRAILRLHNMRHPDQLERLRAVLSLPNFGRASFDYTGPGVGLTEFAQNVPGVGVHRAEGVNFATKESRDEPGADEENKALVTELMALDLLKVFEDHSIRIPAEMELRDDLRKPQRMVSAKGAVRIAASDDAAGHADGFWSLALLVRALKSRGGSFGFSTSEEVRGGVTDEQLFEQRPCILI